MPKTKKKKTPLMQQYEQIKSEHPDAILLFRVGDFYETFGQDAIKASGILGITLTKRANGSAAHIELAGFPHHSLETYLPKLVRAGYRVAICDQLEDPKATKKIVKRGITEVVTPGVAFSDQVLDPKNNNFLACVFPQGTRYGMAFMDVTTAQFYVAEGNAEQVQKFMEGHNAKELLYPRDHDNLAISELCQHQYSFGLDDWVFNEDHALSVLHKQFNVKNMKGFGIEEMRLGKIAAGAVLQYLKDTRHNDLDHIKGVSRLRSEDHMWLDRFTIRNLELVQGVDERSVSLFDMLDDCTTAMGSRLLRRWLLFPLIDTKQINGRLNIVAHLAKNDQMLSAIGGLLNDVGDMERIASKASTARVNPRELRQLAASINASASLRTLTKDVNPEFKGLWSNLSVPTALADKLISAIKEDCPVQVHKGGVIESGISKELDELRHVSSNAKDLLLALQTREAEKTEITSLKVGYNNVFGYYLEVRNTHKEKVPLEWVRKQTLVGSERYVTEELKDLEEKILSAEERILATETALFQELVLAVREELSSILKSATAVATIDVLHDFARLSLAHDYVRPEVNDSDELLIVDGRHPVIERQLPAGEQYVPNSTALSPEEVQIQMITGPNMSGKSALLRQTALLVLMAQIGSFVPASSMRTGYFDRIFTRVGASDNLSTGESTFMVEMNETASILNNLSNRSLLLMDEIGRGTSTYDGISIAWAISEFLHEHPMRPRTLFATHYHELNDMAAQFPRIKNGSIAVKELNGKVIFLRKLVPGGSDRSFGIHVAQMAGMPQLVVNRAEKVLAYMESKGKKELDEPINPVNDLQLSFFQLDDPILERIREEIDAIDIDTLTPVEALLKLNEIKRLSGAGKAKLKKV